MAQSHPLTDAHPFARRVQLRPAPAAVLWGTHHTDGHPTRLRFQRPRAAWAGYPSGWCPPDVREALRDLARGMAARGHEAFRCNCLGRDPEQDAEFRGQGGAAAHLPGAYRSDSVGWHLSGRAVDVTLPGTMAAPTPERLRIVSDMVELGASLGWTPISGEDWHIERRGPWTTLAAARGTREGGLASLLDVGGWRGARWEWRAVQAQLWRTGIDVGPLDGSPGAQTFQGLEQMGLSLDADPSILLPLLYQTESPGGMV